MKSSGVASRAGYSRFLAVNSPNGSTSFCRSLKRTASIRSEVKEQSDGSGYRLIYFERLLKVMDDELKGARMATPRLALLACACIATFSGCVSVATLQDWQYKRDNKTRASEAWFDNHTQEQRSCLGCDYEDGFKAGFFDAATGRDCRVPAVPPPKYWAAKYQCCDGQVCVQNWFKGYQVGMTAAEKCGYPSFNDVPISVGAPVLNKTACGKCYAGDPCSCGAQSGEVQVGSQGYLSSSEIPESQLQTAPSATQGMSVMPASIGLIGPSDLAVEPANFTRK